MSDKGLWERTGWIGPLPPAQPGRRLSGTYTSVSGGGTVAAGWDVMVSFQNTYVFSPDGRFRSGSTAAATAPDVVSASSRATSGRYKIDGYAITMRFGNGTVLRWSYAMTADGLLFLHGDAYTDDK